MQRGLRWSEKGLVAAHEWDEMLRNGAKRGPTLERALRGEMSPLLTEAELAQFRLTRAQRGRRGWLQYESLWG